MTEHLDEIELRSRTPEHTIALGRTIGALTQGGDLIALEGPLGTGKTQLTRGLAAGAGADPALVTSPTFVLMREYPGRVVVRHIDAYRLEDLADLESMGFAPELFEENACVVVEWAGKIADSLPDDLLWVELSHVDEEHREIHMHPRGDAWRARIEALRRELSKADVL